VSWLSGWGGSRRRGGSSRAVMQIAREVVEHRRSVQGALNEVRHPAVLDGLADADFERLDAAIVDYAPTHRDYAIVLARLTHAAARAKGFDRQIVDAALRLDSLLPPDDPSREREKLLRDAYVIAQRAGYVPGGRLALARLGQRAVHAGDTERARILLQQQLDLANETHDTIAEVESALVLGDLLWREGDVNGAHALFRRAGRSAQRLDHPRGIAEALTRQIELMGPDTGLETLAALQRQALDAAQRTSDLGLQSRLVLRLAETLLRNGKRDEAIAQLERGRDIARQIGDLSLESQCLTALVEAERQSGRLHSVAEQERDLLQLEERLGDRGEAAARAVELGATYLMLGEPDQAAEIYERALSLATALNDPALEQRALSGLGFACAGVGRAADALDYLMHALDLATEAGDVAHQAQWLGAIGQTLWRFNQPDDALHATQRALALARRVDDTDLQVAMLSLLGRIYVADRQTSRARECFSRALDLSRRLGLTEEQIQLLAALADLASEARQSAQATTLYEQALRLATETGDRAGAVRLHGRLGRLAQRNRDTLTALDHYRRAVTLAETIDRPQLLNQALQHLATLQHAIGDPEALASYDQALRLTRQVGDRLGEARTLLNLGTLMSMDGQPEEGLSQLYQAARLAGELGPSGAELAERAEAAIVAAGGYPPGPGEMRDPEEMYGPFAHHFSPHVVAGNTLHQNGDAVYHEATLPPD